MSPYPQTTETTLDSLADAATTDGGDAILTLARRASVEVDPPPRRQRLVDASLGGPVDLSAAPKGRASESPDPQHDQGALAWLLVPVVLIAAVAVAVLGVDPVSGAFLALMGAFVTVWSLVLERFGRHAYLFGWIPVVLVGGLWTFIGVGKMIFGG